jgi:hypothetical protein
MTAEEFRLEVGTLPNFAIGSTAGLRAQELPSMVSLMDGSGTAWTPELQEGVNLGLMDRGRAGLPTTWLQGGKWTIGEAVHNSAGVLEHDASGALSTVTNLAKTPYVRPAW